MGKVSFRHRLEYWGYAVIEKFMSTIPDRLLPAVSRSFAFLAYRVLKIRKTVSLQNLRIAFPEKSGEWRNSIAYNSYRHFSRMMMEFMKMNVWSPAYLNEAVIPEGAEALLEAAAQGRGGILVSGHFGNWEMAVGYLHTRGVKLSVIQQRQKNRMVNERMKALREKWGMEIIYPRGAVQNSIRAIKQGRVVALLGDQDAGKRGVFVPFFGRISSTHVGAALIYLRTRAPLFFATSVRTADNRFKLKIRKMRDLPVRQVTDEAVAEVTAAHTRFLEQDIREYPAQYFWMHRRWKTAPPEGETSDAGNDSEVRDHKKTAG